MKKTLIAMAAVAVAGTASAQVNIGGTITFDAYTDTELTETDTSDVTKVTSDNDTASSNILTTSQLTMSGSEDLGGGLSLGFVMNTGSDNSSFGARDRNVTLSGDFGTIRVGRFVPAAAYGWYGYTGNKTTGAGSAYTAGMAGATYGGFYGAVTTATTDAGSYERNDNQIQYTTSIAGITVNANYGSNKQDVSTTIGANEAKQQGISASYAAGALSLAIGQNSRTVDAEGGAAATGTEIDGDLDWYGASYDFGAVKATYANLKRKDQAAAATTGTITVSSDIEINSFGVSMPMGALTVAASMYDGSNAGSAATTDNYDLSGKQVYASYSLSKRTSVYAAHGETDASRAGGNTTSATTKRVRTMMGMLHSF
ncbi:porin [Burkholderiaceae bacterium]|nr:porin [Burkholderiaceae bacterium]